jgi:hypothetical protein
MTQTYSVQFGERNGIDSISKTRRSTFNRATYLNLHYAPPLATRTSVCPCIRCRRRCASCSSSCCIRRCCRCCSCARARTLSSGVESLGPSASGAPCPSLASAPEGLLLRLPAGVQVSVAAVAVKVAAMDAAARWSELQPTYGKVCMCVFVCVGERGKCGTKVFVC